MRASAKNPAVALNRFGLGARPGDAIPDDPSGWLLAQLEAYDARPAPIAPLARTPDLVEAWVAQQRAVRQAPEGERAAVREAYVRRGREEYLAAVGARMDQALQTRTPWVERLVHFWANHFAVSVDKVLVVPMAGSLEADAIRPHVLGRFEDLLLACVRHPAMLLYLDQAQSIGPQSPAGRRAVIRDSQSQRGLNENLAREILELHTLGVRSGYSQADVTEVARALTGWTLPGDSERGVGNAPGATFRFVPSLHEPGARKVLGRTYAEGGEQQALDILHDIATSAATALHVATKLARHFVADEPPPALVRRLADVFLRTGGDLPAVYRELVMAPEAWEPLQPKFKSPWDWGVSSLRALGRTQVPPAQTAALMNQLGQPIWRPGSPAGYDDISATWAAPDALLRRVEVAQRLAGQAGNAVDARALAPQVLPGNLSRDTADAIARADSGRTALALMLVAPEFLRR
jgi:uncharacterized protein (DUF1800 family)